MRGISDFCCCKSWKKKKLFSIENFAMCNKLQIYTSLSAAGNPSPCRNSTSKRCILQRLTLINWMTPRCRVLLKKSDSRSAGQLITSLLWNQHFPKYCEYFSFLLCCQGDMRCVLGLWSSGLWHCVDLQTDTEVSAEQAVSIFMAEVWTFKNKLSYIGNLQEGCSCYTRKRSKEKKNPVPVNAKKWTKIDILYRQRIIIIMWK
jgi:hypothetical protein